MLNPSDFIHLAYTPDLSEAGCVYACRRLGVRHASGGNLGVKQARGIAGEVAVELAIRRYLSQQGIPFGVQGAAPFTEPEHFDLKLGGHRCIIESNLISRGGQIKRLLRDPGIMMEAPALVPMDRFAAEDQRPDDLVLFAFLLGMAAASREDMAKAIQADQPVYLVHALPRNWARPDRWAPLENLAMKSEADEPLSIEIGGLEAKRNFVTVRVALPSRQRIQVDEPFYSLGYVRALQPVKGRLGLHSLHHGETHIIRPEDWGNIWIYGKEILLAGWMSHAEFRQKARVLNPGMRTFQYERTSTKNLMVPIEDLNPLINLLEMIRKNGAGIKLSS